MDIFNSYFLLNEKFAGDTMFGYLFTETMKIFAIDKYVFKVVKCYGDGSFQINTKAYGSIYKFYCVKKWLLPAPRHLIVAARLRGEI